MTSDRLDYGTFELCDAGMVDSPMERLRQRVELVGLMSEALDSPFAKRRLCRIEAGEPTFEKWVQIAQIPAGAMRDGMQKMYAHYDYLR